MKFIYRIVRNIQIFIFLFNLLVKLQIGIDESVEVTSVNGKGTEFALQHFLSHYIEEIAIG